MVLIKNVKRVQWSIGRVVEVHQGEDEVVQVVTVQTSTGTCERPVAIGKWWEVRASSRWYEYRRLHTEICVLHNQTLDEHCITQYGINRHLKLWNGFLSNSVT